MLSSGMDAVEERGVFAPPVSGGHRMQILRRVAGPDPVTASLLPALLVPASNSLGDDSRFTLRLGRLSVRWVYRVATR